MTSTPSRRLVVDDVREVVWGCPVARTADEAVAALETLAGLDELWLDFDLGGDRNRGALDVLPVVHYLVDRVAAGRPLPIGKVCVHSANLHGGRQVRLLLEAAGYRVERRHWAELRRQQRG